jgi:hypothetical protein
VIVALVLLGDVRTTWSFAAFTVLLYYGVTNLAALRLPDELRLYPRWVAMAGLAGCLFLAFQVDPAAWGAGLGALAFGLAWHRLRAGAREEPERNPRKSRRVWVYLWLEAIPSCPVLRCGDSPAAVPGIRPPRDSRGVMTEENPSRSRPGALGSTSPSAGIGGSSREDFFRHFTELVSRVLDAPVALVVLSRADALVVAGAVGLDRVILDGADNPLVGLLRRAADSREPVALKDLAVDPSPEARALVREWGLRAAAAIPLPGDQERPRGVLGVLDRKARRWKEIDLRLLRDLGAAASATTHLLDRVNELASASETLAEAARLLRGTLESLDVAVFVVRKQDRGLWSATGPSR